MFQGIESLQERNGLAKDGIMKPEGPTHRSMMAQMVGPGGEGQDGETPDDGPTKPDGDSGTQPVQPDQSDNAPKLAPPPNTPLAGSLFRAVPG